MNLNIWQSDISMRKSTGVLTGCVSSWGFSARHTISGCTVLFPNRNVKIESLLDAGLIKEYDERFCHILGYRRMASWINNFNHTNYSKNRVRRIMKKWGSIR